MTPPSGPWNIPPFSAVMTYTSLCAPPPYLLWPVVTPSRPYQDLCFKHNGRIHCRLHPLEALQYVVLITRGSHKCKSDHYSYLGRVPYGILPVQYDVRTAWYDYTRRDGTTYTEMLLSRNGTKTGWYMILAYDVTLSVRCRHKLHCSATPPSSFFNQPRTRL